MQMETPTSAAPIEERALDDPRKSVGDRRSLPRKKALRGARIVWSTSAAVVWAAGTVVRCLVRNVSEKGAKIEVHSPVPETFQLVSDVDQSRRSRCVVWRKEPMIGVKFL